MKIAILEDKDEGLTHEPLKQLSYMKEVYKNNDKFKAAGETKKVLEE